MVISAQKAHSFRQKLPRSLQKLKGEPSFSSIGTVLNVSILSDLIVVITCLGFCVSYLLSIGETMPAIIRELKVTNEILASKYFWIVLGTIFVIPISFENDVGDIWWYNSVSLGCAFYLAGLIVVSSFRSSIYWEGIIFPEWKVEIFDSLPIFVFAFTCHQNVYGK
jgi:amino acid permease